MVDNSIIPEAVKIQYMQSCVIATANKHILLQGIAVAVH